MNVFYHSGQAGDIIYSLPTVRAMGGCDMYVTALKKELHESLKPLLMDQDYIGEVGHVSEVELPKGFINLDLFRHDPDQNEKHLVESHLDIVGIKTEWKSGWLNGFSRVTLDDFAIVNRTARYNDKLFNWHNEIEWLRKRTGLVLFLGTEKEFEAFPYHPAVAYCPTANHYEAALLIYRAKYFSGNQSSLLAIAQGLGRTYRMEKSPFHNNCTTNTQRETILNKRTNRVHYITSTLMSLIK